MTYSWCVVLWKHVWILSIMPLILFLIMDPKITLEKILSLWQICLYHYDIICHKVSTLKDLYFKIINKIYRLGLEKPTWNNIKKQKDKINNEHLFTILEDNYSLMESIDNERNMSSHEGNIHLSLLNELSIYLMCSSLQGKLPTMEFDWKYQKVLLFINPNKTGQKEMLEYLNIVKYNAFL